MEDRHQTAVARSIRAVLARALTQPAERVSDVLIDAIAHGTGEQAAVSAAARESLGDRPGLDLVLFDSDEIGSYVFESSRPPVLEGGSAILRSLNREIADRYRDQAVYSGGGEGLLLAPHGEGARLCHEIEERFESATSGALGVTTGCISASPVDFLSTGDEASAEDGARLVSGTRAVLSRLRDAVRAKKDAKLPQRAPVDSHAKRCASCRDRAGVEDLGVLREDERGERLCVPCSRRWQEGKRNISGRSTDELGAWFQEALAEHGFGTGARTQYIGFLYADGNAMGALFGRLGSLADLGFLSAAVSDIYEGLRRRVVEWVRDFSRATRRGPLPMISLLGGGDETIWLLPGALAVAATEKLPEWLAEEVREVPGLPELLERHDESGLTLASGLVLSDAGYPVRYQYALAKELQHHAKRAFHGAGVSSLDFEVITDSYPLSDDLDAARRVAFGNDDPHFRRTCRPYSAAGYSDLVRRARAAAHAEVGTSQLYALQRTAEEGPQVFFNHLCYQVAREPAKRRYQAWLEALGVDPADPESLARFFLAPPAGDGPATDTRRATWLPDLLQTAPFLRLVDDLAKERPDAEA